MRGKVSASWLFFFFPLQQISTTKAVPQLAEACPEGRLVDTRKELGGGGCHVTTIDSAYPKVGRSLVKLVLLPNTDCVSTVGDAVV